MRVWQLRILFLASGLAAACSHPQKPYVFNEGGASERATSLLVDALRAEGLSVAMADPRTGTIVTTWADTGYRFREDPPFNEQAIDVERTVYRRYHLAVVPAGDAGGTTVRLESEARRCTPDVTIQEQRLLGDCRELPKFFPALQDDLDDLGQKLRRLSVLHAPAQPAPQARSIATTSGH